MTAAPVVTTSGPIFWPSSPNDIRDGTVSRLKAMPAFKNVFRQRTFPTKDAQMPLAAVWTARDNASPSGDPNCGSPSFLHSFTLAVDIAASGAGDDTLDQTITSLAEGVRDALLTDASWVQLFEGIQRCNLHYSYPKETDLIMAQATIEIEVSFRSDWPPVEPNDLDLVAMTAVTLNPTSPCSICGTANAPSSRSCSVCSAPLETNPAFNIEFDLREPPC